MFSKILLMIITKLPSIYINPQELLEKAGLLFKIAYLAFSNFIKANISLKSISYTADYIVWFFNTFLKKNLYKNIIDES
jgi:hypothetical protein